MGCIAAPSVDNLYVYILEIKWYHIERPLIYYRFIDDTCMVLKNKLNLEVFQINFHNLKFTESSDDVINFLDLNISYNKLTKKLDFWVHIKSTNSFDYLRTNSNHTRHIFKNIPKSIFIRNRRICSYYSDYILISKQHIQQLMKSGYEKSSLIKLCKSIGDIDRDSLLPYKEKNKQFFSSEHKNLFYFDFFNINLNKKGLIISVFRGFAL